MADECRPVPVTVDGQEEIIIVRGSMPPSPEDLAAMGEVVSAVRKRMEAENPNLAVIQELIMACLAANRCIPDGEVRRGCTITNGAAVKARLKAAVQAARVALTPEEVASG